MSQPHGPPSDPKATTIGLFFDLVFVYAITQVTTLLLSDLSPLGFAKSGLVLFLVWWAWSQYTWMANAVGPACRSIRFGMLVASVPTFFVAFALPGAYAASALWFCLAYFLVREIGLLLYWFALAHDRHQQNALRTFIPFASVAPTLVLVGGFVPEGPRTILYAISMVIDILGALNAGKGNFRISASHFAERYGLLVIIAIGESVIAIGIGAAQAERTLGLVFAITVMLAGVAILFWSYFDWIADAAEHRLAHIDAHRRGRLARDLYTFLHFPIVAGVILYAVAAKKVLAHSSDVLSVSGRCCLAGGIGLFLLGFILGSHRVGGHDMRERTTAVLLIALLCALPLPIPGVALACACLLTLCAALAVESSRRRQLPLHPSAADPALPSSPTDVR